MLDDNKLTPLPGHVILEPSRPPISEILQLDQDDGVPQTMQGVVIRIGDGCDAQLVGTKVMFMPHGGTLLNVEDGQPERMVVAVTQIVGTVED